MSGMYGPPQPRFPRPDWRMELAEREQRERAARQPVATEEPSSERPHPPRREAIEIGAAPPPPQWEAEQLRADRGGRA